MVRISFKGLHFHFSQFTVSMSFLDCTVGKLYILSTFHVLFFGCRCYDCGVLQYLLSRGSQYGSFSYFNLERSCFLSSQNFLGLVFVGKMNTYTLSPIYTLQKELESTEVMSSWSKCQVSNGTIMSLVDILVLPGEGPSNDEPYLRQLSLVVERFSVFIKGLWSVLMLSRSFPYLDCLAFILSIWSFVPWRRTKDSALCTRCFRDVYWCCICQFQRALQILLVTP